MAKKNSYDLIVVGGGPGGYVAAIRAAQLGLSVACVEREHLGGVCLNWGCIPTKALLRSAEVFKLMNQADEFGLSAKDISFDAQKIIKRSRAIAQKLATGVSFLLKKHKVDVYKGEGRLDGAQTILVSSSSGQITKIKATNVILAAGARAKNLRGVSANGESIWNYKHAMSPTILPKSLLIIGSGAIGIEFASFYNTFGTDVTVIEVLSRILPVEDSEISDFAQKEFKKQGMKILTESEVVSMSTSNKGVKAVVKLKSGDVQTINAEKAILAVGIEANSDSLGLDTVKGISLERSHVIVDEWCETGEKGVYAIGDLVGPPWLAHKAMHEGIICVERIAGIKDSHPISSLNIPGCTYCHPQIASVGLTEAQAIEQGLDIKVGRFPFVGNGKAIALGEEAGLIKTIFDVSTGELLGAHMIGAEVTELIQGYTIARNLETTERELMHSVFPHPTLSEMMHESVLDAMGRVIHF